MLEKDSVSEKERDGLHVDSTSTAQLNEEDPIS